MKEFKGTNGSWFKDKGSRGIGPLSTDDDQTYGMVMPVAWVEFDIDDKVQQANANLIAAAPDLLLCLQQIVSSAYRLGVVSDDDSGLSLEVSKAEFYIAKALGETK